MTWLGHSAEALARRLDLPHVVAAGEVTSTMDRAHEAAATGAPAGTLVVAEAQRVGRGREGRPWVSRPGAGLWLTLVERPADSSAVAALSLRVGLRLAPVLERWSAEPVRLKWPNDLFVGAGKLAGVLVEARWRGDRLEWVAIGLGVNLASPGEVGAPTAHLADADPLAVLASVVPAVRAAAAAVGPLAEPEREAFARRDLAHGRAIVGPAVGTARGIAPSGALLVETAAGVTAQPSGSLIFAAPTGGM